MMRTVDLVNQREVIVMYSNLANTAAEEMMALPYDMQQAVLRFIQQLKQSVPHGVSGASLVKFAGFIPKDDLADMSAAIAADCEQIDANEW